MRCTRRRRNDQATRRAHASGRTRIQASSGRDQNCPSDNVFKRLHRSPCRHHPDSAHRLVLLTPRPPRSTRTETTSGTTRSRFGPPDRGRATCGDAVYDYCCHWGSGTAACTARGRPAGPRRAWHRLRHDHGSGDLSPSKNLRVARERVPTIKVQAGGRWHDGDRPGGRNKAPISAFGLDHTGGWSQPRRTRSGCSSPGCSAVSPPASARCARRTPRTPGRCLHDVGVRSGTTRRTRCWSVANGGSAPQAHEVVGEHQ